jgi:hypothetical protein
VKAVRNHVAGGKGGKGNPGQTPPHVGPVDLGRFGPGTPEPQPGTPEFEEHCRKAAETAADRVFPRQQGK